MLRLITRFRNLMNNHPLFFERFKGLLRILVLIISCLFFAAICAGRLENAPVWTLAEQMQKDAAHIVTGIPTLVWTLLVPFKDWHYLRYALLPFGAFLFIFIGSGFYVQDTYHLPGFIRALRYVFSSLFGFFYPMVKVESGRIDNEDPDDESNLENQHLLRAIGGPGFVKIQPGNAVAFRDWQGPRNIETNRLHFMQPFEMIARVVNLEDQHGHIDESAAVTSDGIRLHLKNIDYRFSVLQQERNTNGRSGSQNPTVQRERKAPFPFSTSAIETIAYSFAVSDKGLETWHQTVQRAVSGALGGFISKHDLDYLTAPRKLGQDPRRELRMELFADAVRDSLRRVGAELQWMDIGHFDIDDLQENQDLNPVDQTRTKRWETNSIGDAKTIRALGEAKHLAYQELARAEAQAEMIVSITDALRNVPLGPDRIETLRLIFLARTAQILEVLQDGKNGKG